MLAVFVGYVIFAALSFAIFRVSGQAPHAAAPMSFMALSIVSGMLFACAGGYAAGVIAGRNPQAHGVAVSVLLAIGAGVSLAATLGHGSVWSQVAALLLMAPSAVAGGWFRARQTADMHSAASAPT